MSLKQTINNLNLYKFTDVEVQVVNLKEEVQTHDSEITNLVETMTTLEASMSDLEDIVDMVEDYMAALET